MGINNIFDFTFYSEIFIDYKVQLYSIVRIPVGDKKNKSKRKLLLKKKEGNKSNDQNKKIKENIIKEKEAEVISDKTEEEKVKKIEKDRMWSNRF